MGDACKSCKAPIAWVETKAGKRMPVDAQRRTIVTDAGEVVTGRESHFSTCPDAAKWRQR